MPKEIVGRGWTFPPKIGSQGGLSLTSERSEVEQAIHIILMTGIGERVMRPMFGSRLHELVFAPCNTHTAALASTYTEEALAMWEPRINVLNVAVDFGGEDAGRLLLDIHYEIKATKDQRSLVYPFYIIPQE